MTGGKSLIGEFFKKFEKSNEPIGRFARFLKSGLDGLKQFYMTIKALGSRLLEQIMPDLEELKFEGEAILNDIVSAFQFVLKDIFGDFEGSDEQGLKGFFLALKKLAIEVFPLVVFLTKTFIQQLILQIQLFRGVFGDVASFVYNIVSFLVTNMIQQVNAAIFFFDAFMQQMSMIKIIILGVALFFVKYWGEILNSIFPVIGAVEYLINKIQFLKGILSGLSIPGFDAGQLQNRVAAQARPQAPQSPSTGRAGSVTNNASVGAVNVTVTQTPASPGQITSAVQGGISQGLQEALENANRNLEGGFT